MTDKQSPDASASGSEQTGGATARAQDDAPPSVFSKPNAVMVEPGGAIFQTIGEAIDSIKNASLKRQYLLHLGPGIYREKVVLKPFISIRGAGPGETTITAPAEKEQRDAGTVRAASNCSLMGVTVISHGGTWGYNATALLCVGVQQFMVGNAELAVDDDGNAGINLIAVYVDPGVVQPSSEIYISHSIITATGQNKESVPTCMIVEGATLDVHVSKIIASGGHQATATNANNNARVNIYNSHATGAARGMISGDYSAAITATNSQIEGESRNVTAVDIPPPVEKNQ